MRLKHYDKEMSKLPKGRVTDSKEGWGVYNKMKKRKIRHKTLPSCSADKCNEAFIQKVKNIREPLLSTPIKPPLNHNKPVMREFKSVTVKDVLKALSRDKGTKSVGEDEIPMSILKKVGPQLAEEIADIVNAIIAEGEWPEQWKWAVVVPVWKKKGNKQEPKYYRPVSMLPAIARLVERILAEQLKTHIRENGILPDFQHGFRAYHSTETALIQLIDMIATARDEGEAVVVASLDIAGAFDTLDRAVLIDKLEKVCGIEASVLKFLKNYLEGRKQRVRKGTEPCRWMENPWGVPQGSVLGPLLFILYCADIGDIVKTARIVQYADDMTLVATGNSPEEAAEEMNEALLEFQEYATGSRLAAEPTKTQVMLCARKGEVKCKMDGHVLTPEATMKILGVTLDRRLSWEEHNAKAAGKASGIARSIARETKYLRKGDKAALIRALAHPHLDYCQNALANPSAAGKASICRAYNRTARIAAGMPTQRSKLRTGQSATAREILEWKAPEERRELAQETFASKVWHTGQPRSLRELLPETDRVEGGVTRAALRGEIEEPVAGKVGRKAFRSWATEAYNRNCVKQYKAKLEKEKEEEARG